MKFTGTGVAIVTPFSADNSIDFDQLAQVIEHVIADGRGVDYIVVLGTTGESVTLSDSEKQSVFSFVAKNVAGRVPLVAGIGGNDTAHVVHDITSFDLNGYDAILSVCPYYNKPTQEGIYQHYCAIAQASMLPIILYNVPGRTVVNMTAETTIRLSGIDNIIGIKEASGNLDQIKAIIQGVDSGFFVTSGDDMQTIQIIEMGGVGVISVLANAFPVEFSAITHAALTDTEYSSADWNMLEQLNPHMYSQSNPTGVKTLLNILGICNDVVRLPLVAGDESLRNSISSIIPPRN
jgi:4-hydroxy-tetrahydrodipicolinate synthase